eukprot:COSAG01_NODE_4608_length_4882_cov_13.337863_1_plen_128_part_00
MLTAGCSMPLQTNDHGVKWTELRQGREVLVSTDIIGVSAPSGRAGEGVRATLYKGSDTVGAKRAAARHAGISISRHISQRTGRQCVGSISFQRGPPASPQGFRRKYGRLAPLWQIGCVGGTAEVMGG